MKKTIGILIVAFALVFALPMAVFAKGHGGRHGGGRGVAQSQSYSVCAIEDCTKTGQHYHDGTGYSAHYYADGHDYHGYCDVADCAVNGYHQHDDAYCFGRMNSNAGNGYNQGRHGGGRCR